MAIIRCNMRCTIDDIGKVQRILSDPSVFYAAKDDGVSNPKGLAERVLSDSSCFVLNPYENTLFLFKSLNHVMYEVHVAITESSARSHGVESSVSASRWMFSNTPCQKLITFIPIYHSPSIMFAQVCGMKKNGIITEAFLHNGCLYDMVVLEATKEEFNKLYGGY